MDLKKDIEKFKNSYPNLVVDKLELDEMMVFYAKGESIK